MRVIEEMRGQYPELVQHKRVITEVTPEEEKRFRATLDRGLSLLDEVFGDMRGAKQKDVPGAAVFKLYDT